MNILNITQDLVAEGVLSPLILYECSLSFQNLISLSFELKGYGIDICLGRTPGESPDIDGLLDITPYRQMLECNAKDIELFAKEIHNTNKGVTGEIALRIYELTREGIKMQTVNQTAIQYFSLQFELISKASLSNCDSIVHNLVHRAEVFQSIIEDSKNNWSQNDHVLNCRTNFTRSAILGLATGIIIYKFTHLDPSFMELIMNKI